MVATSRAFVKFALTCRRPPVYPTPSSERTGRTLNGSSQVWLWFRKKDVVGGPEPVWALDRLTVVSTQPSVIVQTALTTERVVLVAADAGADPANDITQTTTTLRMLASRTLPPRGAPRCASRRRTAAGTN